MKNQNNSQTTSLPSKGLYREEFEHDSCGIGFVANIKGRKSHDIIEKGIDMLERMEHRGACGCEPNTGDGAGILIQIPHEFFVDECIKLGIKLPAYGRYGVGQVFMPDDSRLKEDCKEILKHNIEKLGLSLLGFRSVPRIGEGLGDSAIRTAPIVEQVFIECPSEITDPNVFERKLFVLRNYVTRVVNESVHNINDEFYIATCSYKTICYKGQLTTFQVRPYFPDLQDVRVKSAVAVVHSRFATNTVPKWKLAQPFRYIAHNGEINTIRGNVNWIMANQPNFESDNFDAAEMEMLKPICSHGQSDSANLDNVVELLTLSGRSLPHVMMMLIPEAWDGNKDMEEYKKAFYEYHACIMEPWDGPASISFTDGKIVGATLDRNGLRPSRYTVTKDDLVIMASESGVIEVDPENVKMKGRLQPGKMFVVDMEAGRIIEDTELKKEICTQQPYAEWLKDNKLNLNDFPDPIGEFRKYEQDALLIRQMAFGYTSEDLRTVIAPMTIKGEEATGSMGTDIPLAVLSHQSQHFSHYFKQLFAQVTNPPIDPIREKLVMSLASYIGDSLNILKESPLHCHKVALSQPVMPIRDLEKLRFIDSGHFQTKTIQTIFRADGKSNSLEDGLKRICRYASDAVDDNYEVILLSDRSIGTDHAPIPSLLAVAAVHHHLIKKGQRAKIDIVVEAGDCWETHHFATLLGYGASAVNPYIAFSSIREMKSSGLIESDLSEEELITNYIGAINKGLLKIFSKMGISTLQSYQGAQIFEALGIHSDVINKYFLGTVSRIEGLKLDDIAREVSMRHKLAFPEKPIPINRLQVGGAYQWKRKGEAHLFNPDTVHLLQYSTKMNNYNIFKKYAKAINEQDKKTITLRGLLDLNPSRPPISIDEVEPAENIYKRFATGAMSFGSISFEAHTTLAIAMNRLGGRSNTGEGGEDPIRYTPLENGDSMRSAIKQVASGRFGVTAQYLTNADELQIKMAQGAKPGEGGQLPGHKVDDWIGRTRHSTPGVGLISPPPHHDIYSIEDLSQLISDLKKSNREARINVKLVSLSGVGTIAAGVAKAHADVILIAGHDGGTGASPISSIRHAGLPWELGLAETHQNLVRNKLRGRVVLQTDGQLRTGRDIAIATLLGAEEWGIATAALVVEGCIMMRKCHLNTCPVGIATQDPELRARFVGNPDNVVTFFEFLTQDLRETMAEMGYRTIDEMVGQTQNLKVKKEVLDNHWKYKNLDLSSILYKQEAADDVAIYNTEAQDHALEDYLDWDLWKVAMPAIESKKPVFSNFKIKNTDRSIGTLLSNEITKVHHAEGLPEDTIKFKFDGTAGQSFGAFNTLGVTLELEGDANDYFGKGLSGAKLIVYPPKKSDFNPSDNIIIGNVAFYGATKGDAFIRGMAGERFCVRNSGAVAVVEGIGDHGCEYMTGGIAVILGDTGRNFAAGMSGGIAYVWDKNKTFKARCNMGMVDLDPLSDEDSTYLQELISTHNKLTGSDRAEYILANWAAEATNFIKVFPTDYKKAIMSKKSSNGAGNSKDIKQKVTA